MEASKFGFGEDVSPAFKFDPTDADLVANYLLPRAVDLPDPNPHAIIDDDTLSLPPWELLQKHGHGSSEQAFFFEPSSDRTRNGGRRDRTVKGGAGTWRGQRREEHTITLLRPVGSELDLKYKRYFLTFYRSGEKKLEYDIISPPLPNTLVTRIKLTDKSKKDMELQLLPHAEVEAADQVALPASPQPGPSYDLHAVMANGTEQGNALLMEDMQCQQTREIEAVVADQNVFPVQEQMVMSYHPAVMTSAGDVEQSAGYYTPLNADQGGVYYDDYNQYQEVFPCPDQEHYYAGDCGGSEEIDGVVLQPMGEMGGSEELDGVALQPMGDMSGYVHRSLDPFEAAANAEYDEHSGDKGDQPNPQATAVKGAGNGHGGSGEMGQRTYRSLDPFEAATNAQDDHYGDQPNPQAGSSVAVTGAGDGHGGSRETGRRTYRSLDPFDIEGNDYDDD